MNNPTLTRYFVSAIALSIFIAGLLAPFTWLTPGKTKNEITTSETTAEDVNKEEAIVEKKKLSSVDNRKQLVEVPEKPLHQVDIPDFNSIKDIPTKKQSFFDFIRPSVAAKNEDLAQSRAQLIIWQEKAILGKSLESAEETELQRLINAYRIKVKATQLNQINELLLHVDIIPTSLVLVQAANESAWGTSRFARVGLNFFGIWCYKQGCGMVPGGRNTGAKHEVAAFQSVDAAVSGYFNNINKHSAYKEFRAIRASLRAESKPVVAEPLTQGLLSYSERGEEYVNDLLTMLRQNKRYLSKPVENEVALVD